MESKNRNVWIIVVIVAVVILCCCVVAIAAAAISWFVPLSREISWQTGLEAGLVTDRIEQSFEVGATPRLEVDNFAGNVLVRAGSGNTIQVIATKRARRTSDLERIDIDWNQRDDGLRIKTDRSPTRQSNASVALEITVPAGAWLDLETGAGNVTVDGVLGEINAHTGAGSVDVRGVQGPISLDTGAGSIDYEGAPAGECRFETGAGSITLRLPADVGVAVEMYTGVGSVSLGGFDVDGDVSPGRVEGVIGSGTGGTIKAHTGAGSIQLIRR